MNILDEVVKIGQNSRGAKIKTNSAGTDAFAFIRDIYCPSVIVECAFLDNKTDLQIIDTLGEQKAMGVAIAKGVLKTLGITYKPQVTETPPVYRVQFGNYSNKNEAQNVVSLLNALGVEAKVV